MIALTLFRFAIITCWLSLTVTSISSSNSFSRLPTHVRGGSLAAEAIAADIASDVYLREHFKLDDSWTSNSSSNYKVTTLDHFNTTSNATFSQRFFFDTTFCGGITNCSLPSTPIICEFTGEWTASGTPGGAAAELAARIGALTVTLEHRGYGCSHFAGGCSPPLAMDNVPYLSVEQAVEDAADFVPFFEAFAANNFSAPLNFPLEITPGFIPARRWGIVGGSYAGAFVTWATVRHGDLFVATWASSGVVNAIFNFSGFDATVAAAVGDDCANALRAVTAAFEDAFDTRNAELYALFNASATGPTGFSRTDFAWMLADSAGMAPQYGAKATMCLFLNSTARDTPSSPSPPNANNFLTGWSALEAFAQWTGYRYGVNFGASCYYSTACLSGGDPTYFSDGTTWVLQCCNELAYWNINSNGGTRSALITSDYFISQCNAAFGATVRPDTAAFNSRFGGALPLVPSSSNVFAVQGSDDPWQSAGVQSPISSNYRELTATCSGCSHCRDLSGTNSASDPPELTAVRTAVLDQMTAWMTNPSPSSSSSSSLSTSAIVGIVVGAGVGIAVLAYLTFRGPKEVSSVPRYNALASM